MDQFDLLLIALVNLGAVLLKRRRQRKNIALRRQRRVWVRDINMRRRKQGAYFNLFQEIKNDPVMFKTYTRMTKPSFTHLNNMIYPSLIKRSPRALEPEHRVAITLRFLVGDKVPSIAFAFRVGNSTVHKIIKETCDVLGRILGPVYVKAPSKENFMQIAEGFLQLWNFPHCIGAIDGKHVDAQCPPNSGSMYFNYHKRYSIVLMAVCDHNDNFTLVNIGSIGKNSDGGIFAESDLNVENGLLDIPIGTSTLRETNLHVPHFFIGDEAFPLSEHMMRPYPGRYLGNRKNIFNYRLSRARRIIENTFGILARKWEMYKRPIAANPDNITKYVLASVCLHNYLRTEEGTNFEFDNNDQIVQNDNRGVLYARNIRGNLSDYFMSPAGMVDWQHDYNSSTLRERSR